MDGVWLYLLTLRTMPLNELKHQIKNVAQLGVLEADGLLKRKV